MDVEVRTDDFDFEREVMQDVMAKMAEVGEEFVEEAVSEGNYHDVTGHLRASNYYHVGEDGLELGNSADYASVVEARGYEVCSTFALRALSKLKEIFE